MYSPYSWPNFTTGLDMIMGSPKDYDLEFLAGWAAPLQIVDDTSAAAGGRLFQALVGIHCSDRVNRVSSLKDFLPTTQRLGNISRIMGPPEIPVAMVCAQWKIDAKERYKGNFQVAPRKPVLLVGNSYDGHTPIVSARNVSSGFQGSTVLEVNGYGVSNGSILSTALGSCLLTDQFLARFYWTPFQVHGSEIRLLLGQRNYA